MYPLRVRGSETAMDKSKGSKGARGAQASQGAQRPRLRSQLWFDNPDNPGMTAVYLER